MRKNEQVFLSFEHDHPGCVNDALQSAEYVCAQKVARLFQVDFNEEFIGGEKLSWVGSETFATMFPKPAILILSPFLVCFS